LFKEKELQGQLERKLYDEEINKLNKEMENLVKGEKIKREK
jgi:hypothetical protein